MDQHSRLRLCLASDRRRPGLGSVQQWPLGLAGLVWMDLGQLRYLGLGAISLRTLVLRTAHGLVLVSGSPGSPELLVAGDGGVVRIWRRCRLRFRFRQRRLGGVGAF